MKPSSFPGSPKVPARLLAGLVSASLVLAFGGCQEYAADKSNSHAYTGTAGDHIGDDYVYYPTYEVYYNAASKEYVYYDGKLWVRTTQPSEVWAKTMDKTPSVPMSFHDGPEHHHAEIVRQYPRTWQPAPTTNDPVGKGAN